ncbi:hypothetical protein [Apibacter mensalis]|uniref:hypothetical protein n=1 Tax=Apibacter mensalis TaxID=1586267 RepID=UPI0026E9D0C9|nr:hypothetical protein [Apibacter mensalis]
MKKEELAQLLNGRQYGEEMMTTEEHLQAEKNGLLVCFGVADDLLLLRGLIFDENVVYEKDTKYLYIGNDGYLTYISQKEINEIKVFLEDYNIDFILPNIPIKIQWRPKGRAFTWLITTNIPHATFDIYDDEDLYSRGIVLELTDIENYLKN